MNKLEEVLNVLRKMKKKNDGPLPLRNIFKLLMEDHVCDSSKSVADCLKLLRKMGKIKIVNTGIDVELLENVKAEYTQSSLIPIRK